MFSHRASMRKYTLIVLVITVVAGCGRMETDSATTSSPQPAGLGNVVVSPTDSDMVLQPTPTLVLTETQAPPPAIGTPVPSALAGEVDGLLGPYVDSGQFSGSVLIARDGAVLVSKGYGLADREAGIPNTPGTNFRLGSVTKMFTAAAVLLLQEKGRLNVQDGICDYLADCPPAWAGITIHQLLTHTSGIPDFTTFPEYPSWRATPSPPLETLNYFKERPLDFPGGTAWRYSNSGYIVLGLIIEEAAGQPYELFLQENIFSPLNMVATGYDHNSGELAVGYMRGAEADFIDMSIPFAAGGLYSTVEDLFLWNEAVFGGRLLSQDSLEAMFGEHAAIPGPERMAYGYGWVIGEDNGRRVFEHRGAIEGFVAAYGYYPEERVTIIVLSNLQSSPLNVVYDTLSGVVFGEGGGG